LAIWFLAPSFGHNLCFKCPIGSCELISNIYVPRALQQCKELFNPMSFDPCNRPLKIRKFIGTNSQSGNSFGTVGVHSFTLSYTPGNMKCNSQASFWLAPLPTLALVTSPKLRLRNLPSMLLQVSPSSHNDMLSYEISLELGAAFECYCYHMWALLLHANIIVACEHCCCIKVWRFFHLHLNLLLLHFFLYIYRKQWLIFFFSFYASIEDDESLSSSLWAFIKDENKFIIVFFFSF
jgi:hypothetical protein